MGRKEPSSWTVQKRSLSEEQIREVLSLKLGEEYVFSIEDFGDRNPNEFRSLLINYMRGTKHVKISTRVVNGEVRVQLVGEEKRQEVVESKEEVSEYITDSEGFLIDKNGNYVIEEIKKCEKD